MDEFCSWSQCHWQALRANGDPAIGSDADGRPNATDVRPPRTTWGWTKSSTFLLSSECCCSIGSTTEFAVDFVGVAMQAQSMEQRVGRFWGNDVLSGEEARKTTLPIEVLAFDFALGLRSSGVTKADAVKV